MSVMRNVLLAGSTNAVAARAGDQGGVRAPLGAQVLAGRAGRGCARGGGGAAAAGHQYDPHGTRREPDRRAGGRAGHAALSRRLRQGRGGGSRRARVGQADAARPRSRSRDVRAQPRSTARARRAAQQLPVDRHGVLAATSIRRWSCIAAHGRGRRGSASRCRPISIAPRRTSSRCCRSAPPSASSRAPTSSRRTLPIRRRATSTRTSTGCACG